MTTTTTEIRSSTSDLRALDDDELAERYAQADEAGAAAIVREMARRDRKAAQHARDAARWAAVYDLWFPGAHVNYLAAEAVCNGNLVNKAHADVVTDPFSLWTGSEAWAMRCSTDELREFWDAKETRRVAISEFRAGLRADKRAAREAAGQ